MIKAWRAKRRMVRELLNDPQTFSLVFCKCCSRKKLAKDFVKMAWERSKAPSIQKWDVVAKHMEGSGPRSIVRTEAKEPAAPVERIDMAWLARQRRTGGSDDY